MRIAAMFIVISVLISSDLAAQSYQLQYTNQTPQTLTSSLCAVHGRGVRLFEVGVVASAGLKLLAEDGEETELKSEIDQNLTVDRTVTGEFVSSEQSGSVRVRGRARKLLSCVFGMLTATNDGFVGISNLRLPKRPGETVSFRARAYDAGSELNTESCDHVPGAPCGAHFVGIAEGGVVQLHPGISGVADLVPADHGWSEPAVVGTIRRIR